MLPTRYPGDSRQVKVEAALLARPPVVARVQPIIKRAAEEMETAVPGEMWAVALAVQGIVEAMAKMAAVATRVQ
jgi:hypothetical protein